MPTTKKQLVAKLEALAKRWEKGETVDPYGAGPCTDTAEAYVSACADELRSVLSEETE